MKIDTIISNFTSNCYLIHIDGFVYIIDPSVNVNCVSKYIKEEEKVKAILLTHGHIDHIYYLNEMQDYYKCIVYTSLYSKDIIEDSNHNFAYEMGVDKNIRLKNSVLLDDNDKIDNCITALYTPGHSIDSLCFKLEDKLFTGDTLFDGSIGRYDLYSASEYDLYDSIRKIMKLDNMFIYPGHGETSNLKLQILVNPYVIAIMKNK